MSLRAPGIQPFVIVSDEAKFAAQLSCVLARPGSYVPVIDPPRMTRDDRDAEVIRRNNAIARSRAKNIIIGEMSDEARIALLAQLPKRRCRIVRAPNDVSDLATDPELLGREPLRWGSDRIGIGTLKAMLERRPIVFTDEPSPKKSIAAKDHLVVCEMGEPLSEVIAANYAYALGAGLTLVPAVPEEISTEILETYYGLQDPGDTSPSDRLSMLRQRVLDCCSGVVAPVRGSITFISRKLPFGIAFPEVPCTHLFSYPDLGSAVVTGLSAGHPDTPGVEIAVLVDPGTTPAPEIAVTAKRLGERRVFVRGYSEQGATVRSITEAVELFPYDLLMFATHCGDADGYRWTYEFKDYEGIQRTLVVDIAVGIAGTDENEMVNVMQFMRFHSLDGANWADPKEKAKLKVGSAIRFFVDELNREGEKLQPTKKETVDRVTGSAAMKMFDHNYIAVLRNLANNGAPIIINNACVSWHELAARFAFAGCRAYLGTLYPVMPSEADAVVVNLIEKQSDKWLPHALWSAQNAAYKDSPRRPYIMTGVYTQKFRFGSSDAPQRILREMQEAHKSWTNRRAVLEAQPGISATVRKTTGSFVTYYEREIRAFAKRWFPNAGK